ncbi:hypothetical protein VTK73DRAFT_7847 [Phialemonium thermophilum]|uniref:DNA replication factor Cdt1 C-terminal domain-containing protein n=1 Tax=Phialemonium thermophilum TaxID=223376 RepID=A0ABR3WC41_9PEZI
MPAAVSRHSRLSHGKLNPPLKHNTAPISSFARVSKLQSASKEVAKDKQSLNHGDLASTIEVVLASKKRKADQAADIQSSVAVLSPAKSASTKRVRRDPPEAQIAHISVSSSRKRKAASSDDKENGLATPITAPSQAYAKEPRYAGPESSAAAQAEALLERLNLQTSPPRKRSRHVGRPTQSERTPDTLPEELLDLVKLQAAVLKTLTLQYAHNGTNAPVDVRTICANAAQSWGKRRVVLDDLRRCFGVLAWKGEDGNGGARDVQTPHLSDYGRGKICVELAPGPASALPSEDHLNAVFEENLRMIWASWTKSDVPSFIASLPKAPLRTCASVSRSAPLLAKGQRTLDEFKKEVTKKQQEEKEARAQAEPALNPDGSRMSLLDRIRLKEVQMAQAAPPPSPAELQRRAALQRVDDIAGVIGMLSMATAAGRPRISFTMAAILVKLKDSLRIPISPEEGACCVRLIAAEIAPQWLRVVKIGGKENVVIQTAFQPSRAVIQETVKALTA